VAVERVEEADDAARTVHLRTAEPAAAACPVCGVFSTSIRQQRTTRPKDLPYGEAALAVRWHKVQCRCREAACPRRADLSGPGGLLGQTAGRASAAVVAWLDARGQDRKDQVQVVAIDPCTAYRSAVQRALPHARLVADRFHLVRLANDMMTEVRQRVARDRLGRRGRKRDPAWANRRLLLRAGDRLSSRALGRLHTTFGADDPTGELGAAWAVKEGLRMLLAADDRHTIADRLHRFHETVLTADLPETTRLAETVDAWWPEVLGFLETRITNAGTGRWPAGCGWTARAGCGWTSPAPTRWPTPCRQCRCPRCRTSRH
jgi:transposase